MIYFLIAFCDSPDYFQVTIQDPATDILEWMIDVYDLICFELIVIVSIIFVLLLGILLCPKHHASYRVTRKSKKTIRYSTYSFSHSTELEVFWTVIPALLLISIAYPSFNLLYALDDDFLKTDYTIKIIGHQWYWSYECLIKNKTFKFDSYMIQTNEFFSNMTGSSLEAAERGYKWKSRHRSEIMKQFLRLLEVDNRLYLLTNRNIRLYITSADVLHSWAVPSFGIKVDACPGRLTKASLRIKRSGVFYGQCSEICGVNHGFMPIVVHTYPAKPDMPLHKIKTIYKGCLDETIMGRYLQMQEPLKEWKYSWNDSLGNRAFLKLHLKRLENQPFLKRVLDYKSFLHSIRNKNYWYFRVNDDDTPEIKEKKRNAFYRL
jgi:heme/copper-type cytochrome/quinol oxidase subunit 2